MAHRTKRIIAACSKEPIDRIHDAAALMFKCLGRFTPPHRMLSSTPTGLPASADDTWHLHIQSDFNPDDRHPEPHTTLLLFAKVAKFPVQALVTQFGKGPPRILDYIG